MPSFDIHDVMKRVEEAVRPYPKAALFELAERGYGSAFEILVACILSIRTLDEVTLPVALRLFERARRPADMLALGHRELDSLISACSFHERKAGQILAIAAQVVSDFDGQLPCDRELFLSFSGVGPKCANLAAGIACGQPVISADIHVHRIANRWGYVSENSPEKTMIALQAVLPNEYWVDINRLLVPFGKHICRGNNPRCGQCPLAMVCPRIGVP